MQMLQKRFKDTKYTNKKAAAFIVRSYLVPISSGLAYDKRSEKKINWHDEDYVVQAIQSWEISTNETIVTVVRAMYSSEALQTRIKY